MSLIAMAVQASALFWSKRATPKAPRLCTYIESTLDNERVNRSKPIRAVYNTPHETFCIALFLTYSWNLRNSRTVKTKAHKNAFYHMYVCPTSAHLGFRYGYRRCKDNTFILETTLFGW